MGWFQFIYCIACFNTSMFWFHCILAIFGDLQISTWFLVLGSWLLLPQSLIVGTLYYCIGAELIVSLYSFLLYFNNCFLYYTLYSFTVYPEIIQHFHYFFVLVILLIYSSPLNNNYTPDFSTINSCFLLLYSVLL